MDLWTGSCNDNQTVRVKMSSSYCIFGMSIARNSNKYAIESPQSVHLFDVLRYFLFYFVDLEKTKQYYFNLNLILGNVKMEYQ